MQTFEGASAITHCKAKHLHHLGLTPVFTDICKLGDSKAMVHDEPTRKSVPSFSLGYCGFSCKDWASFISNAEEVAQNIIKQLEKWLEDPLGEPDKEIVGTTLPTLLAVLAYILRHKPSVFILENTGKVERILPILKDIFEKMGYVFSSRYLEPEFFKVPNSRLSPILG